MIDELSHGRYPVDALLEGQTFKARAFKDFAIHPRDGAEVRVKDCIFDRCRVTQGSFSLGRGVVLERVLVRDLESVGRWELHSGTRILDSSFECSSPSDQLWIRNPQGDPGCESNRIELDISRFAGEVLITGNDVSRVLTDRARHLFIRVALLEQDRFELNRANFFVSNASKVRRSGSTVGVFSLPRPQDLRLFEGFAEQLEHFESAGLVSRELSG